MKQTHLKSLLDITTSISDNCFEEKCNSNHNLVSKSSNVIAVGPSYNNALLSQWFFFSCPHRLLDVADTPHIIQNNPKFVSHKFNREQLTPNWLQIKLYCVFSKPYIVENFHICSTWENLHFGWHRVSSKYLHKPLKEIWDRDRRI